MSHTSNKAPKRSSNSSRGAAAAEKNRYREIPIQPPNVIARLMGIDAIIPPPKPPAPAAAAIIVQPPKPAAAEANNKAVISPRSAPFRQAKCSLLSYRNGGGDSTSSSRHCGLKKKKKKKKMRHHPQEELLQKMKHDFQAWQASRAALLKDDDTCSATTTSSIQMIAQENLRKQKMARYASVAHDRGKDRSLIAKNVVVQQAQSDDERPLSLEPHQETTTVITLLRLASPCAASTASEKSRDSEATSKDGIHDSSSSSASDAEMSTASIVLLKPTSCADTTLDVADGQKPPLFGLPKLNRDANLSRFLEEVKQMLLHKQLQQQVKAPNDKVAWGSDDPKQQQTAPEDPLTLRSKRFFSRSESFRGFRNDRRRNQASSTKQASPEHVRILTRTILAPSLKIKDDEESITSTRERVVSRSLADASPPSAVGFGEQSFRSECLMMRHRDDGDTSAVSPARALFRSLSAPESGFLSSLGRQLFGDGGSTRSTTPHPQQGAAAMKMTSKRAGSSSFSFIRGTVSSLTRHLLRRRKQTHWSKKKTSFQVGEIHPQMAPPSPETTFNLFKVNQGNLTELPPSPVSPLEVVGHSCRHFFSDFNSSFLPELSPKCLSEFEAAPASELSPYRTDAISVETACSHDKAYIREVLVAAGLYDDDDGSSLDNNKANGRVDSMARPICDDVFEEVEDIYYYRGNYCDDAIIGECNDDAGGNAVDHRLLFDLVNEALQSLVVQAAKAGSSSLRQWVIDTTGLSRGRRLLDDVWQQVQTLRNPEMQEMQTIDSMVAYEIRKSAWAEVLYEDVYVVGRKIERAIFDEMIQDLLIEVLI